MSCSGEMKKGKTTYKLNRPGYHLPIDDVPAWICSQCNEVYFEENVVDNIQNVIKILDTQVNLSGNLRQLERRSFKI
ncbi:MAG: hypothetical protein C3F06_06645 [Candidatus Methanoperedenaceae archaeon]|nr:MAG: hypothetical protein C3F06_06645 [Candidatus Methanoperedenaceae archaeon]